MNLVWTSKKTEIAWGAADTGKFVSTHRLFTDFTGCLQKRLRLGYGYWESVRYSSPWRRGTVDPFGKAWVLSQSSFPSLLLWDKSLKPLWKENRKKVFRPWRGTGICASPRTLVEEKRQEHWEGHTPATKENSVCPRPRLNPNIRIFPSIRG